MTKKNNISKDRGPKGKKENQGPKYICANVKGNRIKKKQDEQLTTQNERRDKAEHGTGRKTSG